MGTTPIYGFPYPDPSDLVANYPALGQELAEDIEAVLPTIGGSVFLAYVSGTGVSELAFNTVFSSTYDHYRIVGLASRSTGDSTIGLQMRSGTTNATGTDYRNTLIYGDSTGNAQALVTTSATSYELSNVGSAQWSGFSCEVYGPFLAAPTVMSSNFVSQLATPLRAAFVTGRHSLSTSYNGFALIGSSLTISAAVYGYRKS